MRRASVLHHLVHCAGQEAPPQCTLGYAAPEVVIAFDERRSIVTDPACDIWALGVMVFEAYTRSHAVDPLAGVKGAVQLARNEASYPWEAEEVEDTFGGSRGRRVVEACLARDTAQRPSAEALVEAIGRISKRTANPQP